MREAQAVGLFAWIAWGLGHGVLRVAGTAQACTPLFRLLETAGVGLAAFSFLGVVLQLLRIPLYWPVYAVLAAVGPIATVVRRRPGPDRIDWDWDREEALLGVLLFALMAIFFLIYWTGANAYPYLEDEDPWMHAQGALYVAKEHTYKVHFASRPVGNFAFYLEPYPPTFDVIMGVMRQVHDSVYWTLKFFNVLLVTLAIGFHGLFCGAYLGSTRKGFFAALILAALPSFMSHFIYSQQLALCVFPVAMYATLRAMRDTSWTLPAIVTIASLMVTQPVVSFVAVYVLILLVLCVFLHEAAAAARLEASALPETLRAIVVVAAGVALSLLYWGAQWAKWGVRGFVESKGVEVTTRWRSEVILAQYQLGKVIFPGSPDQVDQPTGWGPVVAIALTGAFLYYAMDLAFYGRASLKRTWSDLHLVLWFLPLFYIVFAPSFDLPSWGTSRAWAYLAVPVSLLATQGVFGLSQILASRHPALALAVVIAFGVGVLATSAPAKIELETNAWPPGAQWAPVRTAAGWAPSGLCEDAPRVGRWHARVLVLR
jgi:hypothetical protein